MAQAVADDPRGRTGYLSAALSFVQLSEDKLQAVAGHGRRNMSEQDFTRLLSYAEMAIDLLKGESIVPRPEFYELLYTYSTGTDLALNARLDQLFADRAPTAAEVISLCSEFGAPEDAGTNLASVSDRIAARIESVHQDIASAMASANAYSTSLESAGVELGDRMALRTSVPWPVGS
jgi:hypothetical protein